MKLRTKIFVFISSFILITGFVFAQQKDVEGGKDHPLVSRMENYYISGYEEFEYESHDFYDAEDNEYVIEGHKWVIEYTLKGGFTPPGQLKVRRNYINAIKEIGGTILFDQGLYMKVAKDNKETWIEVWVSSNSRDYTLTIVERSIMEQEVAADPDALAGDIKASGHAKVYGIYFDLDSHEIKSKSEPTLQAIAHLLKANSSLKIYVVGHTDMTGILDYNMELSLRRAESVVDILVNTHGIAADRIKAQGAGPLCPVSTNSTEEGRKLNRRVELVEMR
ncbi:MAG: OmpA family protein [Candidatus Aminicenantes bacterium]|nr:OmpA family protein [Candidatus Aminicenantes bacterium]